ncbi:enoyl-CoA hydratase [Sphingobium sp. LB126]|uniref:crotonase/enoyl-CoA hydratase family protein n=1 Tax=Sphingobium sp. LB126 TaxID=1983755 RepID=UPI000C1FFB14|nr:crotonase/enoyl-CoA hydratase family protein [Sphingobium sp. LB126]PJG46407.1 enoyl-CoA hydratase [Sphingobium sp. LB126]
MTKWLTTTETICFAIKDGVARITLNRPDRRNAITQQLLVELRCALLEADDLKSVHCVILEGAGKDFCAGYDIGGGSTYESQVKAEAEGEEDGNAYRDLGLARFDDDCWQLERWMDLKMTIFDLHKPVIAKVHGNCLAGGTDIALLCDMIIAAEDARFGFPPVRAHGSPLNNMWLYHLGPQWAKRVILTGDCLLGRDAAQLGLALLAVPADELDAEVDELARRLAAIDTDLLSANKRIINQGLELMGARTLQRMAHEMDTRAHHARARNGFRNDVATLGLKEALKRRDAPFGDGNIHLKRG